MKPVVTVARGMPGQLVTRSGGGGAVTITLGGGGGLAGGGGKVTTFGFTSTPSANR